MLKIQLSAKLLLIPFLISINSFSTSYYFSGSYYPYREEIKFCETELTIDTVKMQNNDKLEGLKEYLRKTLRVNDTQIIRDNLHFKILLNKNREIDSIETLNGNTSKTFKLNNIQENGKFKLLPFNENDLVEIDLTYDSYKEKSWKEYDDKNAIDGLKIGLTVIAVVVSLILLIGRISSAT